jgi:hypothetical protein
MPDDSLVDVVTEKKFLDAFHGDQELNHLIQE